MSLHWAIQPTADLSTSFLSKTLSSLPEMQVNQIFLKLKSQI
jgi:hypothetical protein